MNEGSLRQIVSETVEMPNPEAWRHIAAAVFRHGYRGSIYRATLKEIWRERQLDLASLKRARRANQP